MVTTHAKRAPLARRLLFVLALIVVSFPTAPGTASPQVSSRCRTFPETGIAACDPFLQYWEENGGKEQQGWPLTPEVNEVNQENGRVYTVQYFERAVFEYHPELTSTNKILLSRVGDFYYRRKYPRGAPDQQPNNTEGSIFVSQTNKRLGGRFLAYWNSHGGVAQQGWPISDEFQERNDTDGQIYTVQYFERAVFEYHPEKVQEEHKVLLSLLGVFRLRSALVQPDAPAKAGWICRSKERDDPACIQSGANGPSGGIVARGGPAPNATLAEHGDILLAHEQGTLPVRYAARSLRLMKAAKLGLWRSGRCTQWESVTLLTTVPGDIKKDTPTSVTPSEIIVNDWNRPLDIAFIDQCVHPQGTIYGVRLWPDRSADVAVKIGGPTGKGALVFGSGGRTTEVVPNRQVHISPDGVPSPPGPIDAEFEKNFARYAGPDLQDVGPRAEPPRPPGWTSSLLSNGGFETGNLVPWTSQINGGIGVIAARPVWAGSYSARVTSIDKRGAPSSIAGGGTCPGGNRVPIVPGGSYTWAGRVYIPESEAPPVAALRIFWYAKCSGGDPIAIDVSNTVRTTGQWIRLEGKGQAPGDVATAHYAAMSLEVVPTNNEAGSAYFDDIQLNGPSPLVVTHTPTPLPPIVLETPTPVPTYIIPSLRQLREPSN